MRTKEQAVKVMPAIRKELKSMQVGERKKIRGLNIFRSHEDGWHVEEGKINVKDMPWNLRGATRAVAYMEQV